MMPPKRCPFCYLPANFKRAVAGQDVWFMDCSRCDIRIEITGSVAAMECQNAVSTLRYIREQMQAGTERVPISLIDMQR
jgi:hypothetical protein